MSASIIVGILSLLAGLLPLAVEYFQRRMARTPAEAAREKRLAEIDALAAEIARLEGAGDLAGADSLRRRLRDLSVAEGEH